MNKLPDIAAKVVVELRDRYVLGYTPKGLGVPTLKPFLRHGYYAPSQQRPLELSYRGGVYLGEG